MNKKVLLLLAAVALGFCLCVIIVAAGVILFAGAVTQPVADVGDGFMNALKESNYQKAFALCSPALQRELGGNAAGLERLIKNGGVEPTAWTFSSRNIQNNEAQLSGTATFTGNRQGTVRITLNQINGEWKVVDFNLREQ
jgi:hypothetical protein